MRSKSILLILVLIKAVFPVGTAEMKGPSLTLHTAVREYNQINWMFGPQNWPVASCRLNKKCDISLQTDEQINNTFRDTLQIDDDGSLNITNVRPEHAGVYTLQIINKSNKLFKKEFNVSVSAPETLSDSLCSQCVHQCPVMNLTRVTLSWNSSSSCAFVEVKYQDSSSSCVVNNSIRDQTEHCQRCSDSGVSPGHTALETALPVTLVTLVVVGVAVVAVLLYKKREAR